MRRSRSEGAKIRKLVTFVDETLSEQGRAVDPPVRRAAAVAVIENPFAGRYQALLRRHDGSDGARREGAHRCRTTGPSYSRS